MKKIVIIGAGPAGSYLAYKLVKNNCKDKIIILDKGNSLGRRICPIAEGKVDRCVKCNPCNIMEGFSGAGVFSDGKYNITNEFGGTLYKKIGKEKALSLMEEVDGINKDLYDITNHPSINYNYPPLHYATSDKYKKLCIQNGLNLLEAKVRHLGTDKGRIISRNLYDYLASKDVEFKFNTEVVDIRKNENTYSVAIKDNEELLEADKLIIAVGRSGSHWLQNLCKRLNIETKSNKIDLGVRVELPAVVFSDLTNELYEAKITYKTNTYEDQVRTFCMNPNGIVVSENTNGIITVNGHSYEDKSKHTSNTNFALLVSQHFTEPFNDSNAYGESIARLSNMLGGGVIVQRLGDLVRGKRTTYSRLENNLVEPTLKAMPGDLSLVLPKRILDDIIEMLYALDKIAPGTAHDDTLLYGVEVKFYNMEVNVDNSLKADDNLYIIGDGSGITHSLSQAAASGLFVANNILS